MEYRRIRHARVRRKSCRIAPAAIVMCIVFSMGVYLFGISKLGTWLAGRVVAPIIEAMLPVEKSEEPALIRTLQPTPEPVGERSCELPSLDCFAIQIGVYADKENAESQAVLLRASGAAGYIVEDGERLRVLAAGYPKITDMQQVRVQLEQQDIDSFAYEIHTDGVRLSASGTQVQLSTLEVIVRTASSLPEKISTLSIQFDRDSMHVSAGIEALSHIQIECNSQLASLDALESAMTYSSITPLSTYFESVSKEIDMLCLMEESNTVAFSSSLKHLYLESIFAYSALIQAITGS